MGVTTLTKGIGYTFTAGVLTISSVTGDVEITAAGVPISAVSITVSNISHGSVPAFVDTGKELTVTFSVAAGFRLPYDTSVKMGGADLEKGDDYTFVNGVLTIDAVTGAVEITAAGVAISSVAVTVSDLTTGAVPAFVDTGDELTIEFAAAAGFRLPEDITITIGTSILVKDTDYEFEDGVLTIFDVFGNVTIEADGIAISTISVTAENIAHDAPASVDTGEELIVTFSVAAGFRLPYGISVKMGGADLDIDDDYTFVDGVLTIDAVTGAVEITAAGVAISAVSITVSDLTTGAVPAFVDTGDELVIEFTAAAGFRLPDDVTVKMGGADLVKGIGYEFEDGVLTIDAVTGAVEITAAGVAISSVVVTASDLTHNAPGTVDTGKGLVVTFTPAAGHRLPDDVTVKMGGADLPVTGYTYVNGVLTISAVTGDVEITADGVPISTVTVIVTGLTHDASAFVDTGGDLVITFTAELGYKLPNTAAVKMGGADLEPETDYTYVDGVLTINGVTGDVEVTVDGVEVSGVMTLKEYGYVIAIAVAILAIAIFLTRRL
jgi:hypothetical protein